MRVVDWCAGAGGKTLALAGAMQNRGQITACDVSASRLDGAVRRLRRAGVHNVERHLVEPGDKWAKRRAGALDRVLVDAPCTGTGTWRRRPDTKWRLTQKNLDERTSQQQEAMAQAGEFVRPGGALLYVTCSVLPEENEAQVNRFAAQNPDFEVMETLSSWETLFGKETLRPISSDGKTITLTPASTDTDGFFFCRLQRRRQG